MQIINYKEIKDDHDFFKTAEIAEPDGAKKIIEEVQNLGDSAIIKYSKAFGDGDFKDAKDFIVSENEIEEAFSKTSKNVIETIKQCANNIETFAIKQFECLKELKYETEGSILGHKIVPISRVLCYVPGGNYPLPSSALMTAIPAKIAGVSDIVLTTPKAKPQTIVAAHIAGANTIYKIGGVQAISAFAYGTQTIKPVDKIVGPGNKYVTYAKKYVFGKCAIDFLAGPSEVLVVADETADAKLVSADLLAQCEHDKDARAYLISTSRDFIEQVIKSAKEQLETLETKDIAALAFEKSVAVVVKNIDEAIDLTNKRAPEHLEIVFRGAKEYCDKFTNYGSLFIGNYCAEVFGDYCSGTNHVLPTNSAARYTGGLSVFDFIKIQTYQEISKNYAQKLSGLSSALAAEEGLMAHKLAGDLRS